ncbi:MAG: hypothetical protein V4632_03965 [Pseudomonadota bacterium]
MFVELFKSMASHQADWGAVEKVIALLLAQMAESGRYTCHARAVLKNVIALDANQGKEQ